MPPHTGNWLSELKKLPVSCGIRMSILMAQETCNWPADYKTYSFQVALKAKQLINDQQTEDLVINLINPSGTIYIGAQSQTLYQWRFGLPSVHIWRKRILDLPHPLANPEYPTQLCHFHKTPASTTPAAPAALPPPGSSGGSSTSRRRGINMSSHSQVWLAFLSSDSNWPE